MALQSAPMELKQVIGSLSRMRSELMTNKPLAPLTLAGNEADADAAVWNEHLNVRSKLEGSAPTWYNTIWLLSECYMYRSITQTLVLT